MKLRHTTVVLPVLLSLCCSRPKTPDTAASCELFRGTWEIRALHDWGKIYRGSSPFCQVIPQTEGQLTEILKSAYAQNMAIRVRGRGHSMNGNSLPRGPEVLVLTQALRGFRKIDNQTVAAGAGASVYAIQKFLEKYGHSLPVFNDGVLGPSLGGYVSAAGIGTRSKEFGGFWSNVAYIRLVDAEGAVHVIDSQHADFPWLFGSMGQLGVITEVGLRILRLRNAQPLPASGTIDEEWETSSEAPARKKEFENSRLTWFTVIAPAERRSELATDLQEIRARHSDAMQYIPEYYWPVKKLAFTPPLFYPQHRDLICIGIWGYGNPTDPRTTERILRIHDDLTELLQKKTYYRRYLQAEPAPPTMQWKEYWDPEIFARFNGLRAKYNPRGNLNSICMDQCPGPGLPFR